MLTGQRGRLTLSLARSKGKATAIGPAGYTGHTAGPIFVFNRHSLNLTTNSMTVTVITLFVLDDLCHMSSYVTSARFLCLNGC